MKRVLAVLGTAAVFALSACGNPTTVDDDFNEPVPGEQQQLPGDDGVNDDLDDDLDDDLNDDVDD